MTEKKKLNEKKLDEVISGYAAELVPLLETSLSKRKEWTTQLSGDGLIFVSNCLAAIGMYRSTKRLERLTIAVAIFTVVLMVFTIVLVWRTFFP